MFIQRERSSFSQFLIWRLRIVWASWVWGAFCVQGIATLSRKTGAQRATRYRQTPFSCMPSWATALLQRQLRKWIQKRREWKQQEQWWFVGLCGQERQSAFTFNVSALNPGHIIVGVVTNDSRITKCASNDECRMVIIRGSLMGGPELPDSIVSVQLVYSYIKALYTLWVSKLSYKWKFKIE